MPVGRISFRPTPNPQYIQTLTNERSLVGGTGIESKANAHPYIDSLEFPNRSTSLLATLRRNLEVKNDHFGRRPNHCIRRGKGPGKGPLGAGRKFRLSR